MAELIGEVQGVVVGTDYRLVPLGRTETRGCSGREWVRMIHRDCAAHVDFANPTTLRVNWYLDVHDCDAPYWMRAT